MRFRCNDLPTIDSKSQMTAMIDIVFQLLVFFIMTFRIVAQEGDFDMRAAQSTVPGSIVEYPDNVIVQLEANATGQLAGIRIGDRAFGDLPELNRFFVDLATNNNNQAAGDAAKLDITIDCGYRLRYEAAVKAIEAISGFKDSQGNIVRLDHAIRFAPVD